MDPIIGGAAIQAGGGLIGGLLQAQAAKKQKAQELAFQGQQQAFETQKQGIQMQQEGNQRAFSDLMNAYKAALVF